MYDTVIEKISELVPSLPDKHEANIADILVAVEQDREPLKPKVSINSKGYLEAIDYKGDCLLQVDYNLSDDRLCSQSGEVIYFLYQVLIEKKYE